MKPMLILPIGCVSKEYIKILNENGICTVEAKDPAKVRFLDPIPASSSRTDIENSAIRLSRMLLNWEVWSGGAKAHSVTQADVARFFVEFLTKGTPLDPHGTREEQEKAFFDKEKRDEISLIARREAREEQAAKRAAKKLAAVKSLKAVPVKPPKAAVASDGSSRAAATV